MWILSDDDIVLDGAIEHVQNVIDDNQDETLALIFVNYNNQIKLKNQQHDLLCQNGNDFFQKTHFKSGLISSNIVSKSLWERSGVERFFDSGWIHFGFDLEALNPISGHKGYIIHRELVKTGGGGRWGQGGTFIYVGFKLVKIFKLMPIWGYRKKTSKMAIFVIKGGYKVLTPMAKIKGLKTNFKLLSQFYSLYKTYPSFWLLDLPLLLIPKKLYDFSYLIMRSSISQILRRKMISNKKNYIFTLFSGFGGVIFSIVLNLLTIPISLNYWKQDRYGIWVLLTSILLYLGMTNLGLNTSASVLMAQKSQNT